MQRAVEDDDVELRRLERQRIEIGLYDRKCDRIVTTRTQPIDLVVESIDGDGMVAKRCKPVRQPTAAGAKVEGADGPLPDALR